MSYTLQVSDVSKRYSGIPVVSHVSFTACAGQVTGYLGPNGSGKSTTMKIITGLIKPDTGEVRFAGEPIHNNLRSFRERLGYVPEEPQLYTHLSGNEYLTMVAQLRSLPTKIARTRIQELLRLFGLEQDRDVSMSGYSKGMRQKVLLAAALLHNPAMILLDEPFSGLDVGSALTLRNLIAELAARGKTVMFSSHELETVERICTRVVILHRGQIVADDDIRRLQTLMALPTLEGIFAQLAIEQDTVAIARQIADVIDA
ncbi:ABC transporter ATP-binding protein [Silvibacterium acidisoli]|uniref:ABC transporter ATP-binding protein n=1 Tax=Acidobacteriaceae bacterium ZG23-2 TaxID=2883246 RepID=UPI00406C1890